MHRVLHLDVRALRGLWEVLPMKTTHRRPRLSTLPTTLPYEAAPGVPSCKPPGCSRRRICENVLPPLPPPLVPPVMPLMPLGWGKQAVQHCWDEASSSVQAATWKGAAAFKEGANKASVETLQVLLAFLCV